MPDIITSQVGPETVYDIAFSSGSLTFTSTYKGAQAAATVSAMISATALMEALKAKLTNPSEIALISGLEAIIASIP